LILDVRFEVFVVVKIKVKVFGVVMPCSVLVEYQHFGEPCCVHVQGEVKMEAARSWLHNPEDPNLN
jgi:hypothetical protein